MPAPLDCPAHAGMDPTAAFAVVILPGLPRARGDGPATKLMAMGERPTAPRTRGWTLLLSSQEGCAYDCPAHAGMDPASCQRLVICFRLPRARGDGPASRRRPAGPGWTAPRTRGWTLDEFMSGDFSSDCPAHAGMDPVRKRGQTRGGGLPRARGDGPRLDCETEPTPMTAPRTRGWTPHIQRPASVS